MTQLPENAQTNKAGDVEEEIKPDVSSEELERLQRTHLEFLEGDFGGRFVVAGVEVVRALNYDLIQILNQLALKGLLDE